MPGIGDTPGIGTIVGDGEGEGVESLLLTGAGVLIGIPGMGAIVGSAANTGAAHARSNPAAIDRRGRSSKDLIRTFSILLAVVHCTRGLRFHPSPTDQDARGTLAYEGA